MFSVIGAICVGDKTSCGGTVVSGSMFSDIDGKQIARIGDQISCRHNCKITTGDMTWIVDGAPIAIHGSQTSHQCVCLSTNNNEHAGVGPGQSQSQAAPEVADAGLAFMPDMQGVVQERHWIEIRLVDGDNQAIGHQAYLVTDPHGQQYEGTLDENGYARVEPVAAGVCNVEFPSIGYSTAVDSCQQ